MTLHLLVPSTGSVTTRPRKAGPELHFDANATARERSNIMLSTTLGFEQRTEMLGPEHGLIEAALDGLSRFSSS